VRTNGGRPRAECSAIDGRNRWCIGLSQRIPTGRHRARESARRTSSFAGPGSIAEPARANVVDILGGRHESIGIRESSRAGKASGQTRSRGRRGAIRGAAPVGEGALRLFFRPRMPRAGGTTGSPFACWAPAVAARRTRRKRKGKSLFVRWPARLRTDVACVPFDWERYVRSVRAAAADTAVSALTSIRCDRQAMRA
jgi:hypothetical protein